MLKNELSPAQVKNLMQPGRHIDGKGLYLVVSPAGNKTWAFMFNHNKRRREMGLGPYPAISLKKARELAQEYREQVALGLVPIDERNGKQSG